LAEPLYDGNVEPKLSWRLTKAVKGLEEFQGGEVPLTFHGSNPKGEAKATRPNSVVFS